MVLLWFLKMACQWHHKAPMPGEEQQQGKSLKRAEINGEKQLLRSLLGVRVPGV